MIIFLFTNTSSILTVTTLNTSYSFSSIHFILHFLCFSVCIRNFIENLLILMKMLCWKISSYRSSHPQVFCKKGVLRNFAKFTGKHLCQRLFFNKVARLRQATLLKKSLWHRYFPMNFANFLRTPFFTEHLRWLLLKLKHNYL